MGFEFWSPKYVSCFGGCWILGFEARTAQNLQYIVFLQCIKVQLSVRFEQLEILPAEYSSSMRVL